MAFSISAPNVSCSRRALYSDGTVFQDVEVSACPGVTQGSYSIPNLSDLGSQVMWWFDRPEDNDAVSTEQLHDVQTQRIPARQISLRGSAASCSAYLT